MNSRDEIVKLVKKHVSTSLDHLSSNSMTEDDCRVVIEDMNILAELSDKKTDEKRDNTMGIDELVQDFYQYADESKQLLQSMLEIISSGKAPERDIVKQLDSSIEGLRSKYNIIKEFADTHISVDEMPADGSSVEEYQSAVINSTALQMRKILDSIKENLQEFIAVRSLVSAYASALKPFQEQAQELFKKLCNKSDIMPEDIENDAAGPRAFLKALSCQDFDSEENIQFLDQITEYYPTRVQMGLASGKYFIDQDELAKNTSDIAEKESMEELAAAIETEEIITVEDDKKDHNIHTFAEIVNAPEENKGEENPDSIENTNEDNGEDFENSKTQNKAIEKTEFVNRLKENGAFISENENFGIFSYEINEKAESKKITSSIFINDMRKGYENAQKKVIKEVDGRNYITSELLVDVREYPQGPILSSLEYLLKKGYLRKYKLTPGGEFYCASPRLMKAFTFKEGCKFAGVKQRSLEDFGENIEDTVSSAAARLVFTKLNAAGIKRYVDKKTPKYNECVTTLTDSFVGRICSGTALSDCELYFGAFWHSDDECDNTFKTICEYIDCCEGIARFTIGGITFGKAKALADSLLSVLEYDFSATDIYLYSLQDDAYEKYGETGKETDLKEESVIIEVEEAIRAEEHVEADKENSANIDLAENIQMQHEIKSVNSEQVVSAANEKDGNNSVDIVENIYSMLISGNAYAAVAYAKACSAQNQEIAILYEQLAYALNDPMAHCVYATTNAFNLISRRSTFEDALVIATAIRTFYSNQVLYDYNIKPFYDGIKDYALMNNFTSLSKVVYSLMEFKNDQKKGLDAYTGYGARSQTDLEKEFAAIKREAISFYENFVIGRKTENASQKRFIETKKLMFSVNSDIGMYIKAIVDDDCELMSLIIGFLRDNFYKEDSTISATTIDGDMLWDYIVGFWEKAGDNMMYRRHADLVSHLRNNIISTTTKAIQLLARWCVLVDQANNRIEDEGIIAYKRLRTSLLDNLSEAISEISEYANSGKFSSEEKAGFTVLVLTLGDIQGYIEGEISEYERKYFYAPFLLTDDIILDENYMPDFDMHSSTMESLLPECRILSHLAKVNSKNVTYRNRLAEILDEQGDDYGVAQLIYEYLSEKEPDEDLSTIAETIESGVVYAKEMADIRRQNFIGELELAQSYGQIDNSVEDQKEKILQIIDEWYEWAVNSSNYGFFIKVMDCYLEEIKLSAKSREKDLLEQLEGFKGTTIAGLSSEDKDRRIARISEMIKEQNYTVAEDLLARATIIEDEHEETIEEDFLKKFLDDYDDYYQPVATHKSNFANLVSSRTRNKEERGAKRLADNWLPGGSSLGKDRLAILLSCLGFKVDSVKPQNPIGKFENFVVQTVNAQNGRHNNYTHPIAAFGSGAAQDGFRVVCINGGYDADGLIDVMKQIGNAKHTLILFDYALAKSERRRLARKTKNALGDKLFAVIDRTVMMFLVRNFDETKINRMLISLIVPFGYYQPYVWESANVMPPEIFMGRKHELERIKSSTGVNIVYGGRQLGKSALLKKAKEDIDWDENGDRAIYVEIKGLNYEQAARKIGHELYDQSILEDDIDTTDWDVLARVIKRRLQSNTKRIPYLLLLLDEADAFIESCEPVNYKPFDSLKEIQSIGVGRFKFVIAGLRNIVRFKREAALGNNSVLTHLEPMTVKPFNTSEARELMEIPLHYLGLRFPKEKESLITLILASTNYFPGLIQLYCAKLLEAMRNKDYAGYDEVDTPVYEVSEEHIKKVLADPVFTQQIREKYLITLRLDEDNYYYLIALLMAYLYHTNGYNEGYSAEDIQNAGIELDIAKIANLDLNKLAAFMEELRELNVLRSTDERHYLFTRFTFFQMMGTSTEVEDKLVEYMED